MQGYIEELLKRKESALLRVNEAKQTLDSTRIGRIKRHWIDDSGGDKGYFTGSIMGHNTPHGEGFLEYDGDGARFYGVFEDGGMVRGALYDSNKKVCSTMEKGQWDEKISYETCDWVERLKWRLDEWLYFQRHAGHDG